MTALQNHHTRLVEPDGVIEFVLDEIGDGS